MPVAGFSRECGASLFEGAVPLPRPAAALIKFLRIYAYDFCFWVQQVGVLGLRMLAKGFVDVRATLNNTDLHCALPNS